MCIRDRSHHARDGFDMGVQGGTAGRHSIDQSARIARAGVVGGLAGQALVFGAAGFHVEIAHENRGCGVWRFRLVIGPVPDRLIVGAAPRAA